MKGPASSRSQSSDPSSSSDTTPISVSPSPLVEQTRTKIAPSSHMQAAPSSLENDRKRRVEKASRARFYLLRQSGPTAFMVVGDSPEHKYRVMLGPQTCSCSRGPHCVHLLFVMLRVLQVEQTNPQLWSKTLRNYEVDSLLTQMQERKRKRIRKSSVCSNSMVLSEQTATEKQLETQMFTSDQTKEETKVVTESVAKSEESEGLAKAVSESRSAGSSEKGEDEDEDICPICLLEMVEGESLTVHINGCGNSLHHHCMAICMTSDTMILAVARTHSLTLCCRGGGEASTR